MLKPCLLTLQEILAVAKTREFHYCEPGGREEQFDDVDSRFYSRSQKSQGSCTKEPRQTARVHLSHRGSSQADDELAHQILQRL